MRSHICVRERQSSSLFLLFFIFIFNIDIDYRLWEVGFTPFAANK